jgi:16S rRNA (guanine966-N2)-methyltransferase
LARKAKTSGRGASPTAGDAGQGRGARARTLRVIGGRHRGRRLRFPEDTGIRPTPDRVRETLFNWLAPRLVGSHCLDLFAGSGIVGLEALSRGAAAVTLVEKSTAAALAIEAILREWGESAGHLVRGDALQWLATAVAPAPFDVVFLDPPFDSDLLRQSAELLERRHWLAPDARIYVEQSASDGLPRLPDTWLPLRTGRAGEVGYYLFARDSGHGGTKSE